MPGISSFLALLSPFERENFFPGALFEQVRAIAPDFALLDPTTLDPAALNAEIARHNPEVLLVCWSTPGLPASLPSRLRYICNVTGSVRRLVTRQHIEDGLLVSNWANIISRTVAECALYHTLACLRRDRHWQLTIHHEQGWRDGWESVGSLFERRVGVHGYGSVAREFLKLIAPFDCAVSVFAPDFDARAAAATGAQPAASLEALFADHDVIVELAPLIDSTRGSVTEKHFRLIRPGGVFINVARAAITDEGALLRVAQEGQIRVGLDVFINEPLPTTSGWRGLRNVSLSPHIAGPTLDRYIDAGRHALRNLRAYAADEPLIAPITPAAYDAAT